MFRYVGKQIADTKTKRLDIVEQPLKKMEVFYMSEENNQQQGEVQDNASNQETSQPITFENEKAFMARVQREAKKQVQEFVKALGFENDGQLKEIVQKQKEYEESQKTEYEKLQEQLQQKNEYINQVNSNLKVNQLKMEALNAGIKKERIDYALKLIDIDKIEFQNGQLNSEQLNQSLNGLLTDFPELKSSNGVAKGGQDFNNSTKPDLLTLDIIKNMSPDEMANRLPEVLKFLEKK